ncbi:signal-transducing adaptor protein 1-like [Cyclopterus lumpus]|uniref:signal-transducing adaptor protein 1-like n=1 Tax=Cyclopterus lumpus TaxID=8103 RepID=UPI00148708E7|nr:signal-transducing adaptor protein 1-like [Cyclopterus lumpus]
MSLPARVVHKRRTTITDLPLYYSGHLLKKLTKEKDFKKYYGELRGTTLFLYKDDTQDTYSEKVDLEQLKSMELKCPYQKKAPTIFTLTLHTEAVQLKMDNSDTGEEWRGYILTVVKKEIPSNLQLLPGQMLLLQEALDQERRRNTFPRERPPLPPRPHFLLSAPLITAKDELDQCAPELPACFLSVSRKEAEQLLEANPECGSIILRPSTLANNYALTLRQLMPSGPVMKNYRVTSTNSGFVIELDTAVTVSSLNDVLKYFLEKTENRLHPYVASEPYDTCIDMTPTPKYVSMTSPTSKTVPRAQVAPMLRSQTKEELLPPKQEESEYVVPEDQCPDVHNLKLVKLDGKLHEVLKLRKGNLYTETGTVEVTTKMNETTEKSHSGTAQWTTESDI